MQPNYEQVPMLDTDALQEKIDNVLEMMCFVIADPMDAPLDEEQASEQDIKAWISFEGENCSGSVQLSATTGFVQEAASGLLGVEPDEIQSEEETVETLLELANVIGGEVVLLLGGENTRFDMGIPSADPITLAGEPEETFTAFDSMGETLSVHVARVKS